MSAAVPQLLVSVRDVAEALAALRGGCDVLDVKEPSRGPLGMADLATITAIAQRASVWNAEHGTAIPVSVALGDARDWQEREPPVLPDVAFVKLGTAGLVPGDWAHAWRRAIDRALSRAAGHPRIILATYADHMSAGSPEPHEVVRLARVLELSGVLLDTYSKSGTTLLKELSVAKLRALATSARTHGLLFALAGSLGVEQLKELTPVEPDLIGVRGAACQAGRESSVSTERVAAFHSRLIAAHSEVAGESHALPRASGTSHGRSRDQTSQGAG